MPLIASGSDLSSSQISEQQISQSSNKRKSTPSNSTPRKRAATSSQPPGSRTHNSISGRALPFTFTKTYEPKKPPKRQRRSKKEIHSDVANEFNKKFTTGNLIIDLGASQMKNKIDSMLRTFANELVIYKGTGNGDIPDGLTLDEEMVSRCHYFFVLYEAGPHTNVDVIVRNNESCASSSTKSRSSAITVQHDDDQTQGWTDDGSSSDDEPDHNNSASVQSVAATVATPTNLNQQTPPAKPSKQKRSTQPVLEAAIEGESRLLDMEERRQRILKGELELKKSQLELEEKMLEIEEKKRRLHGDVTPTINAGVVFQIDCRSSSSSSGVRSKSFSPTRITTHSRNSSSSGTRKESRSSAQ
ncbi:hypothetical protein BGZ76_010108 [Entomortierella beljakovae]|nr:hypothetical protein BGZ76_010108 [Entomortierella beljakovae]